MNSDIDRIRPCRFRVDWDRNLFSQHLQLVDGGGTIHVGGDQQWTLPLLLAQVVGKLGRHGGFTRTLQTHQHNHIRRGAAQVKLILALATKHLNQLVVDNGEHLLRRREAAQHIRANGPGLDTLNELPHQLQADIRLQHRQPHLAHGLLDIGFGQLALPTKISKNTFQTF